MKKIVVTSGYFNPVHSGHINLLKEAKALGDTLVVIVNNDQQTKAKGSTPFMDEQERVEIIKAIKYVDEVFLSIDTDKTIANSLAEIAKTHSGHLIFAKGGDRNAGNLPEAETQVCQKYNIEIVNGVGGGKVQSSSWLIENVVNKFFAVKKNQNQQDSFPSMEVLGNKISIAQIPDVIALMDSWIAAGREKAYWMVVTGMHGVMESHRSQAFGRMLRSADLWVPDGMSLIFLARANGFKVKRRVAGPDLFHAFLEHSNSKGYKHYFYGDTDETLQKLEEKISQQWSQVKTTSFSPPFRLLTPEEDDQIIQRINAAKPDVLWIGLGLPKQETWIFEHRDRLQVPVVIGVGASFKLEAGTVKRAPLWMRNSGLEWLWRLFQEPKRVWRRVFIDMPQFIFLASRDFLKHKA